MGFKQHIHRPNKQKKPKSSNLHRPQMVFGVLSDHLRNKINFCVITKVPGKVESRNITSLNLRGKKILSDNFKGLSVIQHPTLACMYCKQPDPCPTWVPRKKAWKLLKWIFSENEMLDSKSAMLETFSQFLSCPCASVLPLYFTFTQSYASLLRPDLPISRNQIHFHISPQGVTFGQD